MTELPDPHAAAAQASTIGQKRSKDTMALLVEEDFAILPAQKRDGTTVKRARPFAVPEVEDDDYDPVTGTHQQADEYEDEGRLAPAHHNRMNRTRLPLATPSVFTPAATASEAEHPDMGVVYSWHLVQSPRKLSVVSYS